MSTPAVYTEQWANPPPVPATVPAAQLAVAAGTEQVWTMAGGWAAYPPADRNAGPPSMFRIYDPADPREIIRVTHTAGPAWSVRRGDQGSRAVTHAAGFEVRPFITRDGLASLVRGAASGSGLVLTRAWPLVPSARVQTYTANVTDKGRRFTYAALPIPAGEAHPSAVYEALHWGWVTLGSPVSPDPTAPNFEVGLEYAGKIIGQIKFPGFRQVRQRVRWQIHANLHLWTGRGTSNITVTVGRSNDAAQPCETRMFGPTRAADAAATSDDHQFIMWLQIPDGDICWFQGGRIWRAA